MGRFSGTQKPIDTQATKRFFEERGRKMESVGPLVATLYQDQNPALAIERHETELARVKHLLAPQCNGHVLDIGCGTGRWAIALSSQLTSYMGLDFCQPFLDAGKEAVQELSKSDRFAWKQWDLSAGELPTECADNASLIIVAGVFIYVNDEAVPTLMNAIAKACAPNAKIYIREPLGIEDRLTLDDHFSNDLQTEYSAIYRPIKTFETLLKTIFNEHGFMIDIAEDMYPDALNTRAETKQRLYILTRAL
jgi:SAM-dependent methyltransferase